MKSVAVVVIGRNEGDRLRRCFDSLLLEVVPIVYVDSGSNDQSVSLAESRGIHVVQLDPSRPFSAGRARNEGVALAQSLDPGLHYVMLVDGDCEIVPGWIDRALHELESRPELAVVCGRRRELHPEQSVYNRLADLEWDTPIGLAAACGGDAMFRIEDFDAVGGFNETVKAGEEPELCQRLRQSGRLIARIAGDMTRHDLNMRRFAEWWRRQLRVGYHGLDVENRFPPQRSDSRDRPTSLFGPGLIRARVWGIGLPVSTLAAVATAWAFVGLGGALCALGAGAGLVVLQVGRIAWRIRRRVDRPTDALVYGGLMMLDKWANLTGQMQYLRDRGLGRGPQLIEYKRLNTSVPAHKAG